LKRRSKLLAKQEGMMGRQLLAHLDWVDPYLVTCFAVTRYKVKQDTTTHIYLVTT